jgi:hypothetical protein
MPNVKVNEDSTKQKQIRPALAVTPDGSRIYVFWRDYRKGYGEMYLASSTDGGISFNKNVKVNDGPIGGKTLRCPEIDLDANGTIYLTWGDARAGPPGANWVYFAKSVDGGKTFSKNVKVNDDTEYVEHRHTGVAVTSDGRIVYVVWYDMRTGDNDIYFSKSVDGGLTFGSDRRLNDDNTTQSQADPCVRILNDSTVYVLWSDRRNEGREDIYFTKSVDYGESWSRNIKLNDNVINATCRRPYMAVDKTTGYIYATWVDDRTGNFDVYCTVSVDGGETFSKNVKVNDDTTSTNQEPSNIYVDRKGYVYIAWGDYRNEHHDVYLSISKDCGKSFSENVKVTDKITKIKPSGFTKIVVDDDGNIYVVWVDTRNGNEDIYFATTTSTRFLTCEKIGSISGYANEEISVVVRVYNNTGTVGNARIEIIENSTYFKQSSGTTDDNGEYTLRFLSSVEGKWNVTIRITDGKLIHYEKFIIESGKKRMDTIMVGSIAIIGVVVSIFVLYRKLKVRRRTKRKNER